MLRIQGCLRKHWLSWLFQWARVTWACHCRIGFAWEVKWMMQNCGDDRLISVLASKSNPSVGAAKPCLRLFSRRSFLACARDSKVMRKIQSRSLEELKGSGFVAIFGRETPMIDSESLSLDCFHLSQRYYYSDASSDSIAGYGGAEIVEQERHLGIQIVLYFCKDSARLG